MPRRRPGRLFLRIALVLCGSLTLAFAIAATLSIWIGTRALSRQVDEELRGVAHIVHLDLERFLAARRAELHLCAAVEAMDDVVLGDGHFRIQNQLMHVARAYPDIYEELAVLKFDGEVVASTRVERIGATLSVNGLGLLAGPDGTRIGPGPQQVLSATAPVWVMATPLSSSVSRAQSGWLVALVRWSAVSEVVQGTSVVGRSQDPNAFVALMRGNQPIAGHAEWLPGQMSHDRRHLIRNTAVPHEDPSHYTGNESYVEITSGPRPAGWHVVFYRNASQALAPIRLFAWSVLAAGIIGLLVAGALSLRAAGDFTQRVETLRLGTHRLAWGEYTHRVIDQRDDELAHLGDSFNRMAEAMQAARHNIEQSNAELEESNRHLLEASKLKDEFLANTSHELRTPLNGVIGFLELIDNGWCSSHDEERGFVKQALSCGTSLLALIEDVLDVSNIESGRLSLTIATVSVSQALARTVDEMESHATKHGLLITCVPLEYAMLAVRADERRLNQVLRHLVDNAIKFTDHGSVSIACTAPEGAGYVRFEVRDTGMGVALERQAKMFERFVQGDGSSTRRFGGTGLGLSLVRDMVHLMGGVVGLESDGAGRGTCVHFTLPRGSAEASGRDTIGGPPAPEDVILGPSSGPLVLVVEDDPGFSFWLRAILHADGFRTAWTDSAEHAWLLTRQIRPSVIVLDHALPASTTARLRTGAELARHIAENPETARIPVIMLSGHDLVALKETGPLPDGTKCLRKPVQREELLLELRERVSSNGAPSLRILLAQRDPRLLAFASRAFPAEQFRISVERNDDSCLTAVRSQPRLFEVLLLEAPADAKACSRLIRDFAALPAPPPIVLFVEDAVINDRTASEPLRQWPVVGLFSMSEVLEQPHALRARLISMVTRDTGADEGASRAA